MGFTLHFAYDTIGFYITGAVALAAMVLVLRADSRSMIHRLAAIYLFNFSLVTLVLRPVFWQTADGTEYWVASLPDNLIALFNVMWIGAYLLASSGRAIPRWWPWPFLAAGAVVWAVMFARPDLGFAPLGDGGPAFGSAWIAVGEELVEMTIDIVIMGFLLLRAVGPSGRSTDLFHGLAFGLWVFHGAVPAVLISLWNPLGAMALVEASPVIVIAYYLASVVHAMATIAIAAAVVWRGTRHRQTARSKVAILVLLAAWAAVASLAVAQTLFNQAWAVDAYVITRGLLLMLPGVAVAMVLLRWDLVGREVRFHRGVARAATPAAMVAIFFAVSEGAASYFADRLGSTVAGIAAASVLVFAIAPLQRLGERLGRSVAPHTDAEHVPAADRLAVYEQQLRYAWADGSLDRRERERLGHLRASLGIGAEDALRLEQAVAGAP